MNKFKEFVLRHPKKHTLSEEDLKQISIFTQKDRLIRSLLNYNKRENCILIQGGAFVVNNHAFLLLGMGAIDILETLSKFDDINGIMGTGNALFISKDFKHVYNALSESETLKRYEIDKTQHKFKYIESAKLAPLIILNRAVKDINEFKQIKRKKENQTIFEIENAFFTEPVKYSGSLKARLRSKFIKTVRTVHCATHPTLSEKELIFDSYEKIEENINKFNGYFILGYILWSEKFANSIGIESNYSMNSKDNPSEILGLALLKIVKQFYKENINLFK